MIFISAGHNNLRGHKNYDPGAVGKVESKQILEADLTQDFENLVLAQVTKKGFKYITDKPEESLGEYLKRIQTGNGSVVLEFHFDASGTGKGTGSTAIIGSDADRLDKAFAKELVDATASTLKIRNRGVISEGQSARGRLGLMREQGIVSLLEIAFIDNVNDVELYHRHKAELASKIADIVIKYEKMI